MISAKSCLYLDAESCTFFLLNVSTDWHNSDLPDISTIRCFIQQYRSCRNPPNAFNFSMLFVPFPESSSVKGCRQFYTCCGELDLDSPGCRESCRKCDAVWGTAAKMCYKTEHDLIEKLNWLSQSIAANKAQISKVISIARKTLSEKNCHWYS